MKIRELSPSYLLGSVGTPFSNQKKREDINMLRAISVIVMAGATAAFMSHNTPEVELVTQSLLERVVPGVAQQEPESSSPPVMPGRHADPLAPGFESSASVGTEQLAVAIESLQAAFQTNTDTYQPHTTEPQTVAVWPAFERKRRAEAFADVLKEQFGGEYRVEPDQSGFVVVGLYETDHEREQVMARIQGL